LFRDGASFGALLRRGRGIGLALSLVSGVLTRAREVLMFETRQIALALCAALLAAPAFAQPADHQPADQWQRGTTLAVFAGGTVESSAAKPAAGASLGWEIARFLSLEGQGAWIRVANGGEAFAGQMRVRVPFRRTQALVPFVAGGVGLYRASFEAGARRIPEFYQRRINAATLGGSAFTDFMSTVGGGVDVFVTEHLAVRPEASVLLVSAASDTRAVPLFAAHVVYHFDTHPVRERRK
jgi:hypothetical protein